MSRLHANLLLFVAAAFWGFGNVAQKTVLDHLDPLSAVAMRCLIGGLLILPLVAGERGGRKARGHWMSLARVVVLFAVALMFQQASYSTTTVTNASFLVNTATVITPLAGWLLMGEQPARTVWYTGGATMIGALMLCGGFSDISRGDAIALLSAGCYALWMVELGRHMHLHGHPFTAAAAQFLGVAILALPLGAIFGNLSPGSVAEAGRELIVLGVFSTALAFGLQTAAQRFTPARHAAVIVSAEGAFGGLSAALFLGERISSIAALGVAIMLGAILFLISSASERGGCTRVSGQPGAQPDIDRTGEPESHPRASAGPFARCSWRACFGSIYVAPVAADSNHSAPHADQPAHIRFRSSLNIASLVAAIVIGLATL
jgi:drug/metabolite transporter (DMT)-like permease